MTSTAITTAALETITAVVTGNPKLIPFYPLSMNDASNIIDEQPVITNSSTYGSMQEPLAVKEVIPESIVESSSKENKAFIVLVPQKWWRLT